MDRGKCFVCGQPSSHDHHVVPRALRPNNATVPLCHECHSLVPGHPRALIQGQSLSWFARERKRRDKGLQVGGHARFGYRWENGNVVPDEREQAAKAMLADLFGGGLAFNEIADLLNVAGHTRRGGAPWTARTVNKRCVEAGLYRKGPYKRREAA